MLSLQLSEEQLQNLNVKIEEEQKKVKELENELHGKTSLVVKLNKNIQALKTRCLLA